MTSLPWIQIVLAILLVVSILVQTSAASVGGAFGDSGTIHHTRRGPEKFFFIFTIVCGILFVASILVDLLIVQ